MYISTKQQGPTSSSISFFQSRFEVVDCSCTLNYYNQDASFIFDTVFYFITATIVTNRVVFIDIDITGLRYTIQRNRPLFKYQKRDFPDYDTRHWDILRRDSFLYIINCTGLGQNKRFPRVRSVICIQGETYI